MERDASSRSLDPNWIVSHIPTEEPESEGYGKAALRNVGRTGMRAVESTLGLPGDISQGLLSLANLGIEKGLGVSSPLPTQSPIPGSENIREALQRAPEHLTPEAKAKFQGKFEEVSKPRGKVEEFSDEFIKDLIPLTLTGVSPASAAKLSGIGNLASWGAKEVGAGPGWQSGAKIGTMLLASIPGNGPKLREHMKSLYDKAESSIPQGAQVSAKTLEPRIEKLRSLTSTGIETPAKNEILKIIDQLESKIVNGKVPLSEAWQIKKDLNDILFSGKPLKGLERNLNPLVSDFNSLLQEAGKQNPDFVKYLTEADDIYRGLNQSSYIKKQLNNIVTADKSLYALTTSLFTGHPIETAKGLAVAHGIKTGVNIIEPFAKSRAIQNRYWQVVKAASQNNIPTAVKNIKLLDKEIRKEVNDIDENWIVSSIPKS